MKLMGHPSGVVGVACAIAAGVCAASGPAMGQTILHYELEGEPGTVPKEILDSSGNDRHGDVAGDPFHVAKDPGAGDTGLDFTTDLIHFPPIRELNELAVDGNVTVEAIVKPRSTDFSFIVAHWPNPGFQFFLGIEQFTGEFTIHFSDGAGNDIASWPIPCTCRWYHLAGVRDSRSGEVRLYVDGDLVAAEALQLSLSDSSAGFAIGGRHNNTLHFDGEIAEVRVSAAALSPAEFLMSVPDECVPFPWDCADNDGQVGIVDFLALLAQWGQVGTSCDFDGGGVGINDFLKLLANWGPCP